MQNESDNKMKVNRKELMGQLLHRLDHSEQGADGSILDQNKIGFFEKSLYASSLRTMAKRIKWFVHEAAVIRNEVPTEKFENAVLNELNDAMTLPVHQAVISCAKSLLESDRTERSRAVIDSQLSSDLVFEREKSKYAGKTYDDLFHLIPEKGCSLYALNKRLLKDLEGANQKYYEAVRDIEGYLSSGKTGRRVHQETPPCVVCQADTDKNNWRCAGRYVWRVFEKDGKRMAILVGYVPEHESSKGKKQYADLREKAAKLKPESLCSDELTQVLSSAEIKQKEEAAKSARMIVKPKRLDMNNFISDASMYEPFLLNVKYVRHTQHTCDR